ncbi:MAG: hypothetical protein R3F60_28975 [bacterium]
MRHNLLIMLAFLALGGCNDRPVTPTGPRAGSETHWLLACDDDAICGEASACVCGVCTAPCAEDAACAGGAPALCATAASPAAEAACAVLPAGVGGVCLARCARDADCGAGLACDAGACVARARRLEQTIAPAGPHAVDVLFVIDDSGSMCGEQAGLANAMAEIVPDVQAVDARIAVTTTDLVAAGRRGRFIAEPTAPEMAVNCDTDAPPDTADCDDFLGGRALPTIIGARDQVDGTTLKGWFKCLALVGVGGDGFEAGLWAMHRALACDGPNAAAFGGCCVDGRYDAAACAAGPAPDFLRPEADLVVVFVSDEDDCSAPAAFPDATAVPACQPGGGGGDVCTISRTSNANCEYDRDQLEPVATFRDHLLDLKGDPGAVAIWAFVGGELRDADGRAVRFDRGQPAPTCDPGDPAFDPSDVDACCPGGRCQGDPWVACEGAAGEAYAGHRYLELARSFPLGCAPGDPRLDCGLCRDALPLAQAVETLPALEYGTCLDVAPACAVVDDQGLRGCATAAEQADPARRSLRVDVACDAADCAEPVAARTLRPDEYRLTPTALCPSGIFFSPAAGSVPTGGRLTLRGVE